MITFLETTYSPPEATSARASARYFSGTGFAVEIRVAQLAQQVEDSLPLVREADDAARLALTARARSKAFRTSRMSLPLMTWVFQPNAVNLPSIGSMLRTSSDGSGLLEVVAVDDQREVVELVLGGRRGGFPVLPLAELAVAGQHVGVVALLVDPGGQGVADSDRQPLAERAGRGFDARQPLHVRVPFERAAELPQAS